MFNLLWISCYEQKKKKILYLYFKILWFGGKAYFVTSFPPHLSLLWTYSVIIFSWRNQMWSTRVNLKIKYTHFRKHNVYCLIIIFHPFNYTCFWILSCCSGSNCHFAVHKMWMWIVIVYVKLNFTVNGPFQVYANIVCVYFICNIQLLLLIFQKISFLSYWVSWHSQAFLYNSNHVGRFVLYLF